MWKVAEDPGKSQVEVLQAVMSSVDKRDLEEILFLT